MFWHCNVRARTGWSKYFFNELGNVWFRKPRTARIHQHDSWCSLYECMNVGGYNVSQKIGECRKGLKVFKTIFFL